MINDEYFVNKRNKKWNDKELEYLNSRYFDSLSIKETLFRMKNHIEIHPICPKCGKPVKFNGKGFNRYCSRSCAINQDKIKKSIKDKYGVDNISQLQDIKIKIKNTIKSKYGVNNAFNIGIDKSIETRDQNHDIVQEKRKETCIKRYGVSNVAQSKLIQNKIKETSLSKYGSEYFVKSKFYYDSINWKDSINKQINTKKINNSFNTSNEEELCYKLLKDNFKNVIRQYKSIEYPFYCDFYLPDYDLYIEYQGSWTHGGHPFNQEDENDLSTLKLWESKDTDYYRNAITTWTQRDVNKRTIAIQNNLNWLEFWNINEIIEFISNIYK